MTIIGSGADRSGQSMRLRRWLREVFSSERFRTQVDLAESSFLGAERRFRSGCSRRSAILTGLVALCP